ncbi:MAG: S9 family peptidase [Acidobacteria bacterium]|nr:S9 family peptidase [Acidobacteriota bacterium]
MAQNRPSILVGTVCALGVAVPLALSAQQARPAGRPLAIEDYYRIQTIGSPQISPDGRWVSFTLSTRIEEDNSTRTEAYVVATSGAAEPRRVVHYGKDVSNARWTDDSLLQYTADRQQWKVDPANAAALPVKADALPTGAVPSPDRKWLALAKEKPQPKKEAAYISDFERRHQERFKGNIFDWKDFQRDGQPFPAPDPHARPAAQLVMQPVGGRDEKVLVDMDLRPDNIVWHPNGTLLAFTADSHFREELSYERPDLWTVTTDGKVTRLTDDLYVYSDVDFSPDGKYLSYARSFGTNMIIQQKLNHGGSRDLFVRPADGGEPINLTAKWELEPGQTTWSPDGKFIYFSADLGGENHVLRVSVPGGIVEQVTKGPRRLGSLTIDGAFKTISYTVGLHEAPPDVYAANIDGTNERKLTNLYRGILSEVALSKAERLRWPSYDGTEIEGWLLFPHGYDPAKGPYPLIVTSHGGPHSATGYSFDFKKQYFAANGYFVFDTNFRSSTGYGDAFKWATWGEWGKKDGEDVVSGLDYVLKRYPIDPKRVGHTGHSYGGFMTNWLITQYPDRFAAAITGAGISNWTSDYGNADIYRTKETEFFGTPWEKDARDRMIKQSPLAFAGNVRTPTMFVHGEVDQRVPYEEGEQMYFALRRRGIPAKMVQYAGQPHGISGHWNNVHRMINELKWWNQYLSGRQTITSTPAPR